MVMMLVVCIMCSVDVCTGVMWTTLLIILNIIWYLNQSGLSKRLYLFRHHLGIPAWYCFEVSAVSFVPSGLTGNSVEYTPVPVARITIFCNPPSLSTTITPLIAVVTGTAHLVAGWFHKLKFRIAGSVFSLISSCCVSAAWTTCVVGIPGTASIFILKCGKVPHHG